MDNINYLFIEALVRIGHQKEAAVLRDRTIDMINSQDEIYENYHPLSGKGLCQPAYGWSTACFIDLTIKKAHGGIV